MSDMDNSVHLLEDAVALLATGEESIKPRLLRAYSRKLAYLDEHSLPENCARLLQSIRAKLTALPKHKDQSTAEAALQGMRSKAAAAIAAQIVELQRIAKHASAA